MPNTNYRKITQALNYLATKNPDKKINKLKAIKLVWIADRYHLRKYGRPITWDTYEAMPLGRKYYKGYCRTNCFLGRWR